MLFEIFLSLFINTPDVLLLDAKNKSINLEYEQSIKVLNSFHPKKSQYSEYCFYMMVNYYALNDKKNSEKWVKNLRDSFEKLERRHEAILNQIEDNLHTWKENDLADIERDMKISRDRLATLKSNQDTQKIQKQIVDKLDKLIKEEEDKWKDADIIITNSPPTDTPAQESIIGGVKSEGKVDENKLRQISEHWGALPPAKRAKVVEDIMRDTPAKYKAYIDEYFKALNKIR